MPQRNGNQHGVVIATMALEFLDFIQPLELPHMPGRGYKLRIGCHTGEGGGEKGGGGDVALGGKGGGGAVSLRMSNMK